jgi:hypothetical protein
LARFEFDFRTVLFRLSFTFVSFGESCLLVSWCAGGRCGMTCSDEDRVRSRRPGAEGRGWSHRSGTQRPSGREVGWRHVQSAPGTWRLGARVSWLSLKTKVDGLSVVWPQNHWNGFSSVWTSKPMVMVFTGLALKPVATVSDGLSSKLAATVFSS